MLNIRPGSSPDGRYTLVIQLILERRRGVLSRRTACCRRNSDLRNARRSPSIQRKTHVAHIRDVNAFLEKQREEMRASSPSSNGTETLHRPRYYRLTAGDTTTATCTPFSSIRSRS